PPRALPPFPTRRSSDLDTLQMVLDLLLAQNLYYPQVTVHSGVAPAAGPGAHVGRRPQQYDTGTIEARNIGRSAKVLDPVVCPHGDRKSTRLNSSHSQIS